jgi:hypothetical protein
MRVLRQPVARDWSSLVPLLVQRLHGLVQDRAPVQPPG